MDDKVYTVTQLNRSIRKVLVERSASLRDVWIEGEVSGWKVYASGHAYFTLKDQESQISCVLFSFNFANCSKDFVEMARGGAGAADGVKVQVRGELDLYMPRGSYQFKILQIRIAGAGELMARFLALKEKLEKEGLFDRSRKRSLPYLPHRIGIVTSPTGAVIHDMGTVLLRRFPNIEVRLFPAKVQGEGAAGSIVRGVEYFQTCEWRPDVLIVGRGGGSLEDLWAFNEEIVARAVAASAVPVISAVGHEVDFTLCDFAADVRAPTPSAAAEIAVPEQAKLAAQVKDLAARLRRAPRAAGEQRAQTIDHLAVRMAAALKGTADRMDARLSRASARLAPALRLGAASAEGRVARAGDRAAAAARAACAAAAHRIENAAARLQLLNPEATLQRGYSITLSEDGRAISSAAKVSPGDVLETRFCDGSVRSVAS
jgi:exodeoxyribonuclease VII large subunit